MKVVGQVGVLKIMQMIAPRVCACCVNEFL